MRKRCLFIILLLFIPLLSAQLPYVQSFLYKESEITSITTYDITGDGPKEIIVGSRNLVRLTNEQGQTVEHSEGYVTLLDVRGRVIWRFDTDTIDNNRENDNGRAVLSVAAGDLRGDGTRVILLGTEKEVQTFATADFAFYDAHVPPFPPKAIADFPTDAYTSYVYALRPDGTLFWTSDPIYNDNVKMLFVSDLNADGTREIVAVCYYSIYVFDPNGKYFTIQTAPGPPPVYANYIWSSASKIHDVAIDDVDLDGKKEIAVATRRIFLVKDVAGTGVQSWSYPATQDLPSEAKTIFIADVDANIEASAYKDPNPEIIAGGGNFVYVVDDTAGGVPPALPLQWSYETPSPVSDVIVTTFLEPKNIVVASEYTMTILRNDITVLQTFIAPSRVTDVASHDLNMDGNNELLLSGDGLATIYNRALASLWTSRLGEIFIAAIVSDVDLDGYVEILETYNGSLYMYKSQRDAANEGDALFSEAESYLAKKDYKNALIFYQRARDKYKELGDNRGMARSEDMVAQCEKYISAQQLYQQGKDLMEDKKFSEASSLLKQAEDAFRKTGETEMAKEIEEQIRICENYLLALTYLEKSKTLYDQRAFEDAEFFITRARELFVSLNDVEKIQEANALLSKISKYKQANGYFNEGEKKVLARDYPNALSYFEKAERLYDELGDLQMLQKTREKISSINASEYAQPSFVRQYKQYLILGGVVVGFVVFLVVTMLLLILKKQG